MRGIRVSIKTWLGDMVAGLVMALVSIPGGLANGLLAGVNPLYGVFSIIAGTTVAAFFTSSVIMNVDSTSATALATLEALGEVPPERHLEHLVVLGLLVGAFMLLFGILRLGFLTRFISNAVMTGFLSGLGVLTILGQVADLTGYSSDASNRILRLVDTLGHWKSIDPATLVTGLVTIALIVGINRTRLEKYSFLVAVLLTTLVAAFAGIGSIAVVGDSASIPRSLPALRLPDPSLVPTLVVPALAIAIIALVQAAGVSSGLPNPDGSYSDPSGDFRGQGAGNLAAGCVGGLPVGGSLSGSFLVRSVGGRSRWANVFTGLFAALAVLLVGPLIERIPMPTLAGLLIVVGVSMINVPRIQTVWFTGRVPLAIMLLTFIATLLTSVQMAVAIGVVLHLVIHIFRSSEAVRLERILPVEGGGFTEGEVPSRLPDHEIVILQPVGSLFFAGVAELEEKLPNVGDARGTVVILRLRDRDEIGSTFIRAIRRYARALAAGGNKLVLQSVNDQVIDQLERTGVIELIGRDNVYPSQLAFGASLLEATAAAREWIDDRSDATR